MEAMCVFALPEWQGTRYLCFWRDSQECPNRFGGQCPRFMPYQEISSVLFVPAELWTASDYEVFVVEKDKIHLAIQNSTGTQAPS